MNFPLFDTHAHLISDDWDTYQTRGLRPDDPTPPQPNFTVTGDALIAMMDAQNVERACLVQRGQVYGYDNRYIIDSARKYPGRLHPVVILDADDPATPGVYRDMVRNDHVRGFRMAQFRPDMLDTGWLCSPEAMNVWKTCADLGTPLTAILFMNQLPYLLPLVKIIAQMFPDLPIILDHGAMPFGMTQFEVGIAKAAGQEIVMPKAPDFGIERTIAIFEEVPNVHFKITEINFERLAAEDVRPARIVRRMVDSFGPDRLVWGSDIGQSMLWSYEEKAAMARAAADFLSEEEARKFLHGNAARIYGQAGT
ncbi:amidohydrolase family protein [Sphingobium nicotianae]|uniref:Amidohydrolase family protein n=1 Tax=Sphingobium nicotianae TaxID=2782607 RepID=A0A9X1DES6_9SPHN|nr:amidohydrolase family protein [Sphingobium nicotianae]MBT2188223.1 amidohydrolase family protein [Sphingobium nicotianae]